MAARQEGGRLLCRLSFFLLGSWAPGVALALQRYLALRLLTLHTPIPSAQVALDVARALVYLGHKRIVHLDLKSANVLLTRWVKKPLRDLLGLAAPSGRREAGSAGVVRLDC